ncbi:MAG: NAD(P)H-hydrate epimerase, partial [Acidobacteria bacterium]
MKIVSTEEMRAIDRATSERFGVPSLTLMENAGSAVKDHVFSQYASAQRIVVFCGKGNNGGDGFVAARKLHDKGKNLRLILLADPNDLQGDAAAMYRKLPLEAVAVHSGEELSRVGASQADLYVDAILGTGFKPPAKGVYADAIQLLNRCDPPVVA